ncbi:MAG: hypothetical protein WCH98_06195 [Verrucomicrobiota bacterium]
MSVLIYHIDLKKPMWRLDYLEHFVSRLQACGGTAILLEIEDKFRFANTGSKFERHGRPVANGTTRRSIHPLKSKVLGEFPKGHVRASKGQVENS